MVVNNGALSAYTRDLTLDFPWIETMDIVAKVDHSGLDPEDELKRELAFYSQALECAKLGRSRFQEAGAPFNRPDDYFAEMVKSDDQMLRIRKRLLEQTKTIAASEEARRQRDLKKYGGKIQAEKLLDRQKRKSEALDKIKALKRKRGDVSGHPGTEGADDMVDYDDQFDIALSDNEDGESRPAAKKGTKVRGGKASGSRKMPRSSRDAKYGFGGKRRHGKSNTRESLGDLEGNKPGRPGAGGKGKKSKRPGKMTRRHYKK